MVLICGGSGATPILQLARLFAAAAVPSTIICFSHSPDDRSAATIFFRHFLVLTLLFTPARACSCCSAELRDLASAHPSLLSLHLLHTQSNTKEEQQHQQQQRVTCELLKSLLPCPRAPLGAWVSGPQRLVDGRCCCMRALACCCAASACCCVRVSV